MKYWIRYGVNHKMAPVVLFFVLLIGSIILIKIGA